MNTRCSFRSLTESVQFKTWTREGYDVLSREFFIGPLGKFDDAKKSIRDKGLHLRHGMYSTAEVAAMVYQWIRYASVRHA